MTAERFKVKKEHGYRGHIIDYSPNGWGFPRLLENIDVECELLNKLDKQMNEYRQDVLKKQDHIRILESKIHRMRENIKRLEVLYHYRRQEGSVDIKKECWELKQENGRLKAVERENEKLRKKNKELQLLLDKIIC